ncbi:MAG: NUDIX hydrolase [Thermomicrobiales bacterium]|nr:NUDIX hydrolase [Thermomicrobiales bacterium]
MLVIKRKRERFTVRAAGICVRDDHVLLHTADGLDFWALPGGRCEMGELTAQTVQREMWEETGLEVAVGDLLWVMENVFTYEGKAFHELGFYYRATLPETLPAPEVQPEFFGVEGEQRLTFRWFSVAELAGLRLFPTYFRHALRELPTSPVHVVHHDVDE